MLKVNTIVLQEKNYMHFKKNVLVPWLQALSGISGIQVAELTVKDGGLIPILVWETH